MNENICPYCQEKIENRRPTGLQLPCAAQICLGSRNICLIIDSRMPDRSINLELQSEFWLGYFAAGVSASAVAGTERRR
jgi:hypothetical protein